MDKQKIELRKIRDFGQNISDTFQFIRQEFKPFMISFISIAGIFILAEAIIIGAFEGSLFGSLRHAGSENYYIQQTNISNGLPESFWQYYFLLILIGTVTTEVMCVVIGAYFKAYLQSGSSPSLAEVWSIFIKKIFPVFFYSLIPWIMIFIGCCLCLLPGLFLMVIFAPFEIILVVEDCSFGEAFNKCFRFMKDFWLSLGIYIVSSLITYFGSMIIYFSGTVIFAIISKFTDIDFEASVGKLIGAFSIAGYFFFIILYVSICLNYFSMVEKTEATGMMEKLNTIGADTDPNAHIEEEF